MIDCWRSISAALFLVSFITSLVMLAPASVLLSRIEAQASYVEFLFPRGTVWEGTAQSVRIKNVPIGGITFALSVVESAPVSPKLSWRSQGISQDSRGFVGIGLSGDLFMGDANVTVSLASLSLPVSVDGNVSINVDQGTFDNSSCKRLSGGANMSGRLLSLNQEPFVLTGPVSCEDGTVRVRMTGTAGSLDADLRLEYQSDSTVMYTVTLQGGDEVTESILMSLGFVRNGSAYELSGQSLLIS